MFQLVTKYHVYNDRDAVEYVAARYHPYWFETLAGAYAAQKLANRAKGEDDYGDDWNEIWEGTTKGGHYLPYGMARVRLGLEQPAPEALPELVDEIPF